MLHSRKCVVFIASLNPLGDLVCTVNFFYFESLLLSCYKTSMIIEYPDIGLKTEILWNTLFAESWSRFVNINLFLFWLF